MKVRELMSFLSSQDPKAEVIMSSDSEGNNYSPLNSYDLGYYEAENTWSGNAYYEEWTAEDNCMEEDEWETFKNEHALCVILSPTN